MKTNRAWRRQRKIARASFRKVGDDILELRRSINDVAIRLVAWMVLAIFFVGGAMQDIQRQRPPVATFLHLIFGGIEHVQTSFNLDREVKPRYDIYIAMREEAKIDVANGGETFLDLNNIKTYEEFKKSILEQWPGYIYRGYLAILWWAFLLYVLFKPRLKPVRIDRARGVVYAQAWGLTYLEKTDADDLLTALTRLDGAVPHLAALNKNSLLSWRVVLAHYPEANAKADSRKGKFHERFFDLGIWPPIDAAVQRQLLPQLIDDFIHFRDNPLLAEIDHKYHTPFFIRWWLNLSLFGFLRTDRFSKKRTEQKLKTQLAAKKIWDQSEEGQNRARVIAHIKKQRSTPPEEDPFAKLFRDPVPFGKAANDSDHNQPGKYD